MDFLDNSGHIFSLQSFYEEPIGYEFEETKYIFWIDSANTNYLSINNYYAKSINLVIYYDDVDDKSLDELVDINITLKSNKFWLLKPQQIQDLVNGNGSLLDYITINNKNENNEFTTTLTNDDIISITLSELDDQQRANYPRSKVAIIPLYVITYSEDEGTWISNILVHVNNKNYDYDAIDEEYGIISIGSIYIEENEILTINGINTGIELPKEIFKAIYQCSYINDSFNEELYNEKLKEYLLNYMDIKGELGNYNSIEKSLKWFGYGNKISISKLLKTDNQFKNQYIHDFLNIETDVLESFKTFTNIALLSLRIKENEEIDELYPQDFNSFFWGENKPKMKDIFNSLDKVEVGISNDTWVYYKPYYDYSFYEMGLKLSCLKYFYQKYFLPIHLKIHSATISHQVFANDIKFNNHVFNTTRNESPIFLEEGDEVEFIENTIRYFTDQIHYVDDQYNEYESFDEEDDIYKIHETCLNIPIKFKSYNKPYDCTLLLEKEISKSEYKNQYILNILSFPLNIFYYNINIYEKDSKKILDNESYLYRFNKDGRYSPFIEGLSQFKEYLKTSFEYKVFTYNNIINSYGEESDLLDKVSMVIEYNSMYIDKIQMKINLNQLLSNIGDYDENKIKETLGNNIIDENGVEYVYVQKYPIEIINKDYYIYIPSIEEFLFNPMDITDVIGNIIIIPKLSISIKFDKTEIHDFIIYNINNINSKFSIKNNIRINYEGTSKLIYESHFRFIQKEDDETSIYKCFVLYPKILNDKNINYFVNQNFILRLLVNHKWYTYYFTSKMPDIQLDFGKLVYKYYENTDNYYSRFSQLSDIVPNKYNEENDLVELGKVKFNAYMHEPDLVNVHNIKYISDIEEYLIKNNLGYINKSLLGGMNFNKFIVISNPYNKSNIVKETKIYISDSYFNKFSSIEFNIDYIDYPEIYIANENLIFILVDNNDESVYKKINIDEQIGKLQNNKFVAIFENNDANVLLKLTKQNYNNIIVSCINKNEEQSLQSLEVNDNDYNVNVYSYEDIYQPYSYNININNNRNYLNKIYVYDLKKKIPNKEDILNLYNNFEIACNGIVFKHTNDTLEDLSLKNKIFISGKTIWTNQAISDEEYLEYSGENWNQPVIENSRVVNIDSRIVDKYGFYWGNKYYNEYDNNGKIEKVKLEAIYKKEFPNIQYFYYFNETLNRISNSEYDNYIVTIKVGDCMIDNFTEIGNNEFNNKIELNNNDLLGKISSLNINYNQELKIFNINYFDVNSNNLCENVPLIVKFEYIINGEEVEYISNSNYLKLWDPNIKTNIKIKVSFYVNYSTNYKCNQIFVDHNNVQTDDNGPYTIIDGQIIRLFIKTSEFDLRNDQYIPYENPAEYSFSFNEIINGYENIIGDLDDNTYSIIDQEIYEKIKNIAIDEIDNEKNLSIYWLSGDNTNELEKPNSYWHEKTYLQKDLLEYINFDENDFMLKWDSSDMHIVNPNYRIKCEILIIDEFGNEKIIKNNGEIFKLTNKLKKATLYFIIQTDGTRGFEIEDGWIIPHIYYDSFTYENIPYEDDPIKIINLYNDFFKVGIYDKTNNELLSEYAYEVENIYQIEKEYDIWKQSNHFNTSSEITNNLNSVILQYNDAKRRIELDYNISKEFYDYIEQRGLTIDDINNYSNSEFNKFIYNLPTELLDLFIIKEMYIGLEDNPINMMNDIQLHNFINLAKYDFAYKHKIDFYDVKVINNDDFKEEIKYISYEMMDENYVKIIQQNVDLYENSLDYDLYLMHDNISWYIVFISKETLNKNLNIFDDDKNPPKTIEPNIEVDGKYINNTNYVLEYKDKIKTLLINRMKYISGGGVNHFDKSCLVACKILNNNNLPVNIYNSSKWEITPMSLNMNRSERFNSNAEMTIFSLPMNNNEYQSGYYNVNVRYCLDKNVQHQFKKTGKIRIN